MTAVVREWRGRVPREKADAYMKVLRATGLKNYASTRGHLGTLVLRNDSEHETEYVLLTFWHSPAAISEFAGADIGRAVYYPEDEGYLLEKPERLNHYEIATAQGPAVDAKALASPTLPWPPLAAWR